jgi:hypothetical protein
MVTKEFIYYTVRKKYYVLGQLKQPRQSKKSLVLAVQAKKPIKKGPLSFVLFESPITSVSTVSRSHPSLIFLL